MENDLDTQKINKILELTLETNETVKKMRRSQKIQNTFRVIYWIILIGTTLGVYYFLKPTIVTALNDYNNFKTNINYLNNNSTNVNQIKNILKGFGY